MSHRRRTRMLKKTILLLFLVFLTACTTAAPEILGPGQHDAFAQCLYASGVRMYGSYTCSVCQRERDLFGNSIQYIQEIECHPRGENPQTDLCLQKNIQKTPTWTLEQEGIEVQRLTGYQPLETLAELSGCTLPHD
jgi:hypothetical protein